MAAGGLGALIPPRATVLLYWHTTLSRNPVPVFNNEAREREARAFILGFPRKTNQTFSLSQTPPAGVPYVPVPTGLSPHSQQLHKKKDKQTENSARMHFIEANNNKFLRAFASLGSPSLSSLSRSTSLLALF